MFEGAKTDSWGHDPLRWSGSAATSWTRVCTTQIHITRPSSILKKNGFWFLIPDYMTLNHWVIESYENENENVKNRSRIQIQKNKQLSPVGLESGVWQQPSPPLRACVFSKISALLSARISRLCWMTLPNAWTMLSSHQRPKSLNLRKWESKRIISIQNTE